MCLNTCICKGSYPWKSSHALRVLMGHKNGQTKANVFDCKAINERSRLEKNIYKYIETTKTQISLPLSFAS